MGALDVVDETFLAVSADRVAELLGDRRAWRRWWPDLALLVVEQRGPAGIRWQTSGALTGTMEVWLEPMLDGTLLHYYLHAELAGAQGRQGQGAELSRAAHGRRLRAKAVAFELKARLEHGRPPGHPPAPAADLLGHPGAPPVAR